MAELSLVGISHHGASLEVRERPQAYPVHLDDGEVTIEAATLLGIAVGDRFRLVSPDGKTTLGEAEVGELLRTRQVSSRELTGTAPAARGSCGSRSPSPTTGSPYHRTPSRSVRASGTVSV